MFSAYIMFKPPKLPHEEKMSNRNFEKSAGDGGQAPAGQGPHAQQARQQEAQNKLSHC